MHAEALNAAVVHAAMVSALGAELAALQCKLKRVGHIGDFGASNDPALDVALPPVTSLTEEVTAPAVKRPRYTASLQACTLRPVPG